MTQSIIVTNVLYNLSTLFATITPNIEVLAEEMKEIDDI